MFGVCLDGIMIKSTARQKAPGVLQLISLTVANDDHLSVKKKKKSTNKGLTQPADKSK